MGVAYYEGHGVPQSYKKAVHWWRKAANQVPAGQMADAPTRVQSTPVLPLDHAGDGQKAQLWRWDVAATFSQIDNAKRIIFIQTTHFTNVLAARLSLASQGYADAQSNLGELYRTGSGVPRSDKVALKWYRKAAAQGHAVATDQLKRLEQVQVSCVI